MEMSLDVSVNIQVKSSIFSMNVSLQNSHIWNSKVPSQKEDIMINSIGSLGVAAKSKISHKHDV